MMFVYLFFSLITVISLGRCEEECPERYSSCIRDIQEMKGAPFCRRGKVLMKCLVNTTGFCLPSLKDTVEKYQMLIEEGCRPESTFFRDAAMAFECLIQHSDAFESCKLEGEFNNAAEVCRSVYDVLHCARLKMNDVCGNGKEREFWKLLRPVQDLFDDCKNSQDFTGMELDDCYKRLVKCDRNILTRSEYTCPWTVTDSVASDLNNDQPSGQKFNKAFSSDWPTQYFPYNIVERNARCYIDVAERHCDLDEEGAFFTDIAEKYVDQLPDYCNPQSTVLQNFEKSGTCIGTKYEVLKSCQDTLSNILDPHDESEEHLITIARAGVEYGDCLEGKIRSICGEEAAFVMRYILDPIVTISNNKCLERTGEKCNGAIRVKSTILLLIFFLKYILTKEDEWLFF